MTHEQKQLLIKDLCGRLPYEVICKVVSNSNPFICGDRKLNTFWLDKVTDGSYDVKPYLRPMSSMTEEEKEEIEVFIFNKWYEEDSCKIDKEGWIEILANYDVSGIDPCFCSDYVDWLNEHHFDYHIVPSTGKTLIESGVALRAPEGMYKTV